MTDNQKTVSLVLGSGGARGHAHLGVIDAIEERGMAVENIAGSSMGAVIGGIYAADELDVYREWAFSLTQRDVVRLLDLSFTVSSLFSGDRLFDVLKELVGERDIESLSRSFTAVATAIDEQSEVWLNRGSLFTAIRASSSVPGVFSPVELDGQVLVDGGVINPIPIAPTLSASTDLTIAVNLNSLGGSRHEAEPAESAPDSESEASATRAAIRKFIDQVLPGDNGEADETPDAMKLLIRSVDTMQGAIARLKLAAYSPDVIVDIPRNACSFFEFHRAEEMRDIGYERAAAVLDELSG